MRFTYAEAMTDPSYYAPLAQAAEAAGYTSMTVADSLIYPEESDSTYPYTDTGEREFLEGKAFIETMILCAHLFAVTSTLRLTPFVLKLPVRPPVLVAKQVGSVAWLSGNRLGLGIGLSPWPEDFQALDVPWAKRGKRMDECMDILRGLTSGEYFGYDGEFYSFPPLKQTPAPTEKVPLLVGGHADAALRRAVLKGDGWMHAGGDGEELDRLLARLAEIRKAEGDTRDGLRGARHLLRRLRQGRPQTPGGQGRDRLHRRLPGALHQGARHRAARGQGGPPREVRRDVHRCLRPCARRSPRPRS